jgi:hypothetical protein
MHRTLSGLAFVFALTLPALSAQAQDAAPHRIRGTIESVNGANLTIKPSSGASFVLHLADGARVVQAVAASAADVKPGTYVGITNEVGPDGKQTAVEVHIFPEAMRGTGAGERSWDLSKTSRMTNGAVGTKVTAVDGDKLEITYKGGSSTITLKPGTQIMAFTPGSVSDLKPGTHVFVRDAKAGPDGVLQAGYIVAGKDGFAPAM